MGGRSFPIDAPANAPARYGAFSPVPKIYRIDLGAARDREKSGMGGSFIWGYKASGTGVSVDIRFNSQQADPMTFYVGTSLQGLKFSEVYISNDAQAGGWIDFLVVDQGEQITGLNPANVFTAVTVTKATDYHAHSDVTLVAAATTLIDAADATRRTIIVQSLPSNTQDIRVGSAVAGATRGILLQPGDIITIDCTDAVYGYTAAGADQTVALNVIHD